MHLQKKLMLLINILGGTAVLGSYMQGILSHSNASQILWGGVPQSIRPFYTAGMFIAATGYFLFTYFIFFRLNPQETHVTDRLGFELFNTLYAIILFPSALWMPLTFLAVEQSNTVLLWVVRLLLVVVGVASIGLFIALMKVMPRHPLWAHRIALVGVVGFCVQTAILDAIIWGLYFG